jgi:hypothetical protein
MLVKNSMTKKSRDILDFADDASVRSANSTGSLLSDVILSILVAFNVIDFGNVGRRRFSRFDEQMSAFWTLLTKKVGHFIIEQFHLFVIYSIVF